MQLVLHTDEIPNFSGSLSQYRNAVASGYCFL